MGSGIKGGLMGRKTFFCVCFVFYFWFFFEERNQSSNAAKGFHPTQHKLSERCFCLAIEVFFFFWVGGGLGGVWGEGGVGRCGGVRSANSLG